MERRCSTMGRPHPALLVDYELFESVSIRRGCFCPRGTIRAGRRRTKTLSLICIRALLLACVVWGLFGMPQRRCFRHVVARPLIRRKVTWDVVAACDGGVATLDDGKSRCSLP